MTPTPTTPPPTPEEEDLANYAPATNPSRFEHTYRKLQSEHETLQHDLNMLHADIRMRMYLLNVNPKGYVVPTREEVEEWIQILKPGEG